MSARIRFKSQVTVRMFDQRLAARELSTANVTRKFALAYQLLHMRKESNIKISNVHTSVRGNVAIAVGARDETRRTKGARPAFVALVAHLVNLPLRALAETFSTKLAIKLELIFVNVKMRPENAPFGEPLVANVTRVRPLARVRRANVSVERFLFCESFVTTRTAEIFGAQV